MRLIINVYGQPMDANFIFIFYFYSFIVNDLHLINDSLERRSLKVCGCTEARLGNLVCFVTSDEKLILFFGSSRKLTTRVPV